MRLLNSARSAGTNIPSTIRKSLPQALAFTNGIIRSDGAIRSVIGFCARAAWRLDGWILSPPNSGAGGRAAGKLTQLITGRSVSLVDRGFGLPGNMNHSQRRQILLYVSVLHPG